MLDARQKEQDRLVKTRLISLAEKMLRPLVRLLIRYGMSCQEFSEIVRWVFVDTVMHEKEFALGGRSKQFKSRAAVLTGLSRKEILRLTGIPQPQDSDAMQSCNRAARVLTGWCENKEFLDASGRPRVLKFRSGQGSFAELVRQYSGDVPPRAILDELKRCEAVTMIGNGEVHFRQFSYHAPVSNYDEIEQFDKVGDEARPPLQQAYRETA
ncbi:MAG: DUF6502 family protein [Gammaproteobacteria bacterium]